MYGFSTTVRLPFDAAVARVTEALAAEEANGRVTVAFMDPHAVLQLVERPEVHALGEEVKRKLERVHDALR